MMDLVPDGHKAGWLLDDEDEAWFNSLPEGTPFKAGVDFDAPPAERIFPSDWIRIENQNGFGSCQGHALSSVMEVAYWIASRGQVTQLSRWMAYVGTQQIDGIRGDQGSTISGGAKLAETYGVCPEEVYPYPRRYTQSISESQYEAAKPYRLRSFRTMRSVEDVRNWLDAGLGGISIGVRWGSGGHAIAILEVLRDGSGVNVANSWGTSWGKSGWFTWTWRELEGKLRESYTRAIGMSDMAEIAPREWDFTKDGGVMG